MNANFNLLNENRKAHWKNICVSTKTLMTIIGRWDENSDIGIHIVSKQSSKSL